MQWLLAFLRGNKQWNENLPHIFCNAKRMCNLNMPMILSSRGKIGWLHVACAEYAGNDSVIHPSGAG